MMAGHVQHRQAARDELGRRLAARRKALRLTRLEVAAAAGVSVSHVGLVERGRKAPSLGVLLGLARVLGLDPGTLVRGLHRL